MDFIKWNRQVLNLLQDEHNYIDKKVVVESYKFYRSNYTPEDTVPYLSNILYYKDMEFLT